VEEDKAGNKRSGAAPGINNPALKPPERPSKKGEPALQVIGRQAKGPKHPDKKEAFQDINSLGIVPD
jgi:hypothetical protein